MKGNKPEENIPVAEGISRKRSVDNERNDSEIPLNAFIPNLANMEVMTLALNE